MKLSVIVPCFNEEKVLNLFYEEITGVFKQMKNMEVELLFVNDGSEDMTLELMKRLARNDSRVKYLSFSRNFGKEAAIYAGLRNAAGDLVTLMDADLQDPPELLPDMISAIVEEGYDSVATRRVTREGEPLIRSFFARLFYQMMSRISDTEIMDGARDFRMMNRSFVDAILRMGEYNRFSKGLFGWIGFRTRWLAYENRERVAGETKWSFWKLFCYSMEGITAFSTAPLLLAALFGIALCGTGGLCGTGILVKKLLCDGTVTGWSSLMCAMFFLSGLQLLCIGILGLYLSRTYLEVKNRPRYICRETNIDEVK